MATKRVRPGGSFEYTVKRSKLLKKPIYLTFTDEDKGDAYVAQLEALLDRGIVPAIYQGDNKIRAPESLGKAIRRYLDETVPGASDIDLLHRLINSVGTTDLITASTSAWVIEWHARLKREQRLAPGTIKKYTGALARCLDWCVRQHWIASNPCRQLPRRYAHYATADARAAGIKRQDNERDRRLEGDEETRIRAVLAGAVPDGRNRALVLHHPEALVLLFDLGLETAMRLREMFTLTWGQVDLAERTVFLDKTKNGDRRQVPLSTVAVARLTDYQAGHPGGWVFPWWDGNPHALGRITSQLSQQFRRVFKAAGCEGLRFHDLRHEATCRLYERTTMSDLQIAKITGHKDIKMLRRYANLRGSDLAGLMW